MDNKKASVLIVDDEPMVCDLLRDDLNERGYLCTTALSGNDALTSLAKQDFDAVLLDIRLPGMSGMEVLRRIWVNHSDMAKIMITAVNDINTAVDAMKLGASDYIVKPFELDRVDTSIRQAIEAKQATKKPHSEMDTIARGVEANLDPFSAYSKVVTQRTIEVAWQLGIAEEEIERWAAAKAKLDSDRDRVIESSLEKLRRSPLAQNIMGIAVPYPCTLKPDESQN